jgi:DNA-binding transcriptional LysR family regulator
MMDRIEAMRVFLRVAETGSFSVVARERGTQQPTISKQVAGLERGLGVRLLQRTTRTLSLTEEGRAFVARAAAALDAFDEAQACVGPGREAPPAADLLPGRLRTPPRRAAAATPARPASRPADRTPDERRLRQPRRAGD